MILAPRPPADINLTRLETLDQEIGAAAKTLPGLKDGKNALDEALEGSKKPSRLSVRRSLATLTWAVLRRAHVSGRSLP